MSNLKVRPKEVDFSNVSKEYAKAEIMTKVPVEKMKRELIQKYYENFKDEARVWMRHMDIIKTEHKLKEFDTMSPNGESKLLIYIGEWLSNISENEIKDMYVTKVLEGEIQYYD